MRRLQQLLRERRAAQVVREREDSRHSIASRFARATIGITALALERFMGPGIQLLLLLSLQITEEEFRCFWRSIR